MQVAFCRHIETMIGTEFSARFYRALDELIGALAPHAPHAPQAPQAPQAPHACADE